MVTVGDVAAYLERFAPSALAAEWDNVGLLLGDRGAAVEKIMTCLTVTPASAAEAIDERAGLIVTHHPILFRGVKRLTADTPEGRMLWELSRAAIAVYSPHTAFDNTAGGINDLLAARVGLTEVAALRRRESTSECKLVTFVPDADLGRVSDALFAAGAGRIGDYTECSFRIVGTGTFFGGATTNPTVGAKGRREEVAEWRLEVVCPAHRLGQIVAALRGAHSYEEPAFDIYPLRKLDSRTGAGRVGRLEKQATVAELARRLRQSLGWGAVHLIGDRQKLVQKAAVVCGAGGDFITDAIQAGADVLLTGEARFHDCLAAEAAGLALILPGHYATERPGIEELAVHLQKEWPGTVVWPSRRERDPLVPV